MFFLLLLIFGLSLVAFWVDRRNKEETHILVIAMSVLTGMILVILAPWEIKLITLIFAFILDRLYPISI
jgi:hypothetical protein